MPLDPQVRTLLDQLAAAGGSPLEQMSPEAGSGNVRGITALAGAPEEVAGVEDLKIPGPDGNEIPIRVYTPESGQSPRDRWSCTSTAAGSSSATSTVTTRPAASWRTSPAR